MKTPSVVNVPETVRVSEKLPSNGVLVLPPETENDPEGLKPETARFPPLSASVPLRLAGPVLPTLPLTETLVLFITRVPVAGVTMLMVGEAAEGAAITSCTLPPDTPNE